MPKNGVLITFADLQALCKGIGSLVPRWMGFENMSPCTQSHRDMTTLDYNPQEMANCQQCSPTGEIILTMPKKALEKRDTYVRITGSVSSEGQDYDGYEEHSLETGSSTGLNVGMSRRVSCIMSVFGPSEPLPVSLGLVLCNLPNVPVDGLAAEGVEHNISAATVAGKQVYCDPLEGLRGSNGVSLDTHWQQQQASRQQHHQLLTQLNDSSESLKDEDMLRAVENMSVEAPIVSQQQQQSSQKQHQQQQSSQKQQQQQPKHGLKQYGGSKGIRIPAEATLPAGVQLPPPSKPSWAQKNKNAASFTPMNQSTTTVSRDVQHKIVKSVQPARRMRSKIPVLKSRPSSNHNKAVEAVEDSYTPTGVKQAQQHHQKQQQRRGKAVKKKLQFDIVAEAASLAGLDLPAIPEDQDNEMGCSPLQSTPVKQVNHSYDSPLITGPYSPISPAQPPPRPAAIVMPQLTPPQIEPFIPPGNVRKRLASGVTKVKLEHQARPVVVGESAGELKKRRLSLQQGHKKPYKAQLEFQSDDNDDVIII